MRLLRTMADRFPCSRTESAKCGWRLSTRRARGCRAIGLLAACLLVAGTGPANQRASGEDQSPLTVRVGVQPYADDGIFKDEERERYRELCQEIADYVRDQYHRPIRIQIATGSYADLYYWCQHEMIDIAVVAPGVYALLVDQLRDRWTYLCTMGQGPDRKQFQYGVECVAAADARIESLEQIRTAFYSGLLDIFLVDPKSTSGGIFPLAFLKQQGIPAYDKKALDRKHGPVSHVIYTGSHGDCLKTLSRTSSGAAADPQPGRLRIGFVSDGALQNALATGVPVKRVALPELEAIKIPESAVVVNTGFYRQHQALLDQLSQRRDFLRLPQYEEKYDRIRRWRDELSLEPPAASDRTDWPNFFRQLETHMRTHKTSPRMALVLAGGGAKCAFQVGVIRAIEEEFRKYRAGDFRKFVQEHQLNIPDLDISLVVGTSGGAINALPAALGTYKTDHGVQILRGVWQSLDARDILQPELAVRLSVGALIFLIQFVAVLLLVRISWRGRALLAPAHRGRVVAAVLLLVGTAQIDWAAAGWKLPWDALYYINSGLFVVWALAASGTMIVGGLLVATGAMVGLLDLRLRRRGSFLAMSPSTARETIAWLTLIILVSAVPIALHAASFISHTQGLESHIAHAAEQLINERLTSRQRTHAPVHTRDLGELGRVILEEGLLERDLMITATILPERSDDVSETDVYFYASAEPSDQQNVSHMLQDPRVQYLNTPSRRGMLLQAVMGSGAVFPVFPARTIVDCPTPGHRLQLVDGSFCHHNPIEAATLWGATHVIVVNPSPAVSEVLDPYRRTLYENSQVALQQLFDQAQNLDRRAEQNRNLTVFFINPEADKHDISLLSFAKKPIEEAIDHAQGELDQKQKPFRRRLSRPQFLEFLKTSADNNANSDPDTGRAP